MLENNNHFSPTSVESGLPRISVAPMLDWTDRHYRAMARLLSRRVWLYTEMITTGAIIHGDRDAHLGFNCEEMPVALQLGGSDPTDLRCCAKIGEDYGYNEINLNVGCPSDRVQRGRFGACLMKEPELVAECIDSMQSEVSIPVTVKCRIGVDEQDSYEHLSKFVETVSQKGGCTTVIVHARKAWLKGLSPKENREKPPLQYERVFQLKKDFPLLNIEINGGIESWRQGSELLHHGVNGLMVGRAAYYSPYLLAEIDQTFFGDDYFAERDWVFEKLIEYASREWAKGVRLHHMARHWINLFQGLPGGKLFRRHLSENAFKKDAGVEVLHQAYEIIQTHKKIAV